MADNIGLHELGHGLDDVQVSARARAVWMFIKWILIYSAVDNNASVSLQHESDHGVLIPDHTVIKKG